MFPKAIAVTNQENGANVSGPKDPEINAPFLFFTDHCLLDLYSVRKR